MTDFDRVRSILDAATPGPWVPQSRDDGATAPWYVDTHAYPDGPEPVWAPPQYPVSLEDVVAIVVARNLLPELIAVAEAAEEVVAALDAIRDDESQDRYGEALVDQRAALAALDAKMKETLT